MHLQAMPEPMNKQADRPFGPFERSLAFRYLLAKREHGGVAIVAMLSLIGVTLAVAALIIIMSIMSGFRGELISRVLGNTGHVLLFTSNYQQAEIDFVANELQKLPEVTDAIPVVDGAVLASAGFSEGAYVRGISSEDALNLPFLQTPLVTGSVEGFGEGRFGGNGILVSSRLAQRLNVIAGDKLTLIAPEGASTVSGIVPRRKAYEVLGTFQIFAGNANPLDDVLVIMPIEQAQLFFNQRQTYTRLELKLQDPQSVDSFMMSLNDSIAGGLPRQTWKQRNRGIVGALEVERSMMRLIFAILITITALNIITGIVMLVKNKGRDIAILRTMGATRSSMLRVFVMIGAVLGTLGMVFGVTLGVLVCVYIIPIQDFLNAFVPGGVFNPEVYGLPYLPADLDWREVGFAAAYAFIMSVLVTLLPAWNAARLDPVEALRTEG